MASRNSIRDVLVVGLAVGLAGCASMRDRFGGSHAGTGQSAGFDNQVAVFDGHLLWVDYACEGGQTVTVKYVGEWADAKTADGAVHLLERRDAGWGSVAYSGDGFDLSGPGMSPTWTAPGASAVRCQGKA